MNTALLLVLALVGVLAAGAFGCADAALGTLSVARVHARPTVVVPGFAVSPVGALGGVVSGAGAPVISAAVLARSAGSVG